MDKKYSLEGSAISYEFGFEGDNIYYSMIRNLVDMRYDNAIPLLKELAKRGLVSDELVAKYA